MNVWRKVPSNRAVKPGIGIKTIVRRSKAGWSWLVLTDTETLASGTRKTQADCRNAIREARKELEV